jgi:hypothetical protein
VAALAVSVSCADAGDPGGPSLGEVAYAPGGNRPAATQVKVRRVMLDGDLFELSGTPKDFSFEIDNSGPDLSAVRVEATIVQAGATRLAASFSVSCPGASTGGLPQGMCTMAATATASNASAGTGTLVAGDAQFIVTILQDAGGATTTLASRKTGIALAAEPGPASITSVVFPSPELVIDGANVPWTATLSNPTGGDIAEVFLQGLLVQGGVEYGGGGVNVRCAPAFADAVLTTGTCVVEWTSRALSGGIQPGAAEFVLVMLQGFGENPVELDRHTVPVTILSGAPTISSINFPETTLTIGGPSVNYGFTATNPTAEPIDNILFQGLVLQAGVEQPAGGLIANCPTADGILPPGTCTMSFTALAANGAGIGTLQPGAAEFVLILYDTSGFPPTELHRVTVPITLVSNE